MKLIIFWVLFITAIICFFTWQHHYARKQAIESFKELLKHGCEGKVEPFVLEENDVGHTFSTIVWSRADKQIEIMKKYEIQPPELGIASYCEIQERFAKCPPVVFPITFPKK